MRPENFDLLSGEYHRDKRDKAKEKERLTGIAEGRPMDSDDNSKALVSDAVKKAPYAPTVEPAHPSSASASASATSSHSTPPSPPTAAFTPTLPTTVHTSVLVSAPIVSPVPASIPTPHVPETSPTSTAIPASLPLPLPTPTSPSLSIPAPVPVPVPAPMSGGRPPTVPQHHTPLLVPPVADLLNKGSVTGLAGIAEVSNRAKVSHVPFDGTLPPLGAPDSDPSVAESEDEHSPNEAPYRRKWGSKTDGGDTSDKEGSEKEVAISMEGDATLREWMKTAQVCQSLPCFVTLCLVMLCYSMSYNVNTFILSCLFYVISCMSYSASIYSRATFPCTHSKSHTHPHSWLNIYPSLPSSSPIPPIH